CDRDIILVLLLAISTIIVLFFLKNQQPHKYPNLYLAGSLRFLKDTAIPLYFFFKNSVFSCLFGGYSPFSSLIIDKRRFFMALKVPF
ncbi:hypothetical protein, partial [Salmonella enterica]|uniref:hypothetical protein n=1 Tax=Salmonella enterica TaxID=28901 RepID=UPI0019569F34